MAAEFAVCIPSTRQAFHWEPDQYEFKSSKPLLHRWLQRICLGILDKLGCQRRYTRNRPYTKTVRYTDIVDAILGQRYAVESIVHGQCRAVVLGVDQMRALELADSGYWGIVLPQSVGTKLRPQHIGRMFAGLEIIFCPWFEGILCLPSIDALSFGN